MEIPSKVRIGSTDYEVKLTKENLVCDGRECVGTIDYGFHIINIQEGIQDKQAQEITFLHELLHGIVRERNLEIENEELVVEEISRGLHQVIRDNTNIFINKSVGGNEKGLGELCAEEKGIKIPKHPMYNHLLKRGQFGVEKMYMNKCSLLTVGAEEYIQGMEDGFARLDAYRYPYIKDPTTGEVFLIKPTEINMVVTSLTDNNPDGNKFVLTKDEFDKKYDPIG